MAEEKNDLVFFVKQGKPDFVLANIGYTQKDLDKMQAHLDKAPENDKGKVANLGVLVSKSGKPYAKLEEPFVPNPSGAVNSSDKDDDLPF